MNTYMLALLVAKHLNHLTIIDMAQKLLIWYLRNCSKYKYLSSLVVNRQSTLKSFKLHQERHIERLVKYGYR